MPGALRTIARAKILSRYATVGGLGMAPVQSIGKGIVRVRSKGGSALARGSPCSGSSHERSILGPRAGGRGGDARCGSPEAVDPMVRAFDAQ